MPSSAMESGDAKGHSPGTIHQLNRMSTGILSTLGFSLPESAVAGAAAVLVLAFALLALAGVARIEP